MDKIKLLRWAFSAAVLVLLATVLIQLDFYSVMRGFREIPTRIVLFLVAAQIFTQLLVNLQWYLIARKTGVAISYREMFFVNCQGAVMDAITPGVKIGGEVARAVQIKRVGNCSAVEASTVVALQKFFSVGTMLFVMLLTVGFMPGIDTIFIYGILLSFLVVFAGIMILLRSRGWKLEIGSWKKSEKLVSILLPLITWLIYPAKMFILTWQFYPEVHFFHIASVVFLSYMVALIPIFPGGLGGFEATMVGLLTALGFSVGTATAVTIMFRFITFWFVMLVGAGVTMCKKLLR